MTDLKKEDRVEIIGTEYRGHVDYVSDVSVDVRTEKALFTVPKELVKVTGPALPREPKGNGKCIVTFKSPVTNVEAYRRVGPYQWAKMHDRHGFPWYRWEELFEGYPDLETLEVTVYWPSGGRLK